MLNSRDYRRIERAIGYIREHRREQPSVDEIAGAVALSPAHFARMFQRWAGMPPQRYLRLVTLAAAKQRLDDGAPLLEAAGDAGLSGPGRLHDLFVDLEAMSPGEYRAGGAGTTIHAGEADSPFGRCLMGWTERGICALEFDPGEHGGPEPDASHGARIAQYWPHARVERDDVGARRLVDRVFGDDEDRVTVCVRGTNFQVQVWRALLRIPMGQTTTYGHIAEAVGRPGASRAVGTAVGANPVAWLIPCHRVLRRDGELGGYHWGPDRKAAMLAWEALRRSA